MAPEEDDADPVMVMVIKEAVAAGIFRRAARLNAKTAAAWHCHGDAHSERVTALLEEMLDRAGAGGAGPCRCG